MSPCPPHGPTLNWTEYNASHTGEINAHNLFSFRYLTNTGKFMSAPIWTLALDTAIFNRFATGTPFQIPAGLLTHCAAFNWLQWNFWLFASRLDIQVSCSLQELFHFRIAAGLVDVEWTEKGRQPRAFVSGRQVLYRPLGRRVNFRSVKSEQIPQQVGLVFWLDEDGVHFRRLASREHSLKI